MRSVVNSGGLGAWIGSDTMAISCVTGQTINCESFANFFDLGCWGFSPYASAACTPTIPASVVAGPGVPALTSSGNADCSAYPTIEDCAQAISDAQIAQTQQNVSNFVATNGPVADSCSSFTANWPYPFDGLACPTLLFVGIGAALALFLLSKAVGR